MLFGKSKLEMKVGVFVFFGLVILVIFVLSIGGFKSWASGRYVKFQFGFINGVKIGAPVRFAGVDVGQVKKINFINGKNGGMQVEILGWVEDRIKIPEDSTVWVNTLGLLGEKYIEIMPGNNTQSFLPKGAVIEGKSPVPMHEMESAIKKTTDQITSGEGTVGKLIFDETLYDEIEAMVKDLRRNPWKIFWKTKEKK